MSIHSIGVDLVEIDRIEKIINTYGEKFLNKIYTIKEIHYCRKFKHADSFAARFAAKEAVLKATGMGLRNGMKWTDIEIENNRSGKPEIKLKGRAAQYLETYTIFLSLSHTRNLAIAMVVVES
jgi:holo-[acyl-carrier protein] synthase